jgi:hypothetical protein
LCSAKNGLSIDCDPLRRPNPLPILFAHNFVSIGFAIKADFVPIFARIILAGILLAFGLYRASDIPTFVERPVGCDAFGYMRQAHLFRSEGIKGFNTRLEFPVATALVTAMKNSGLATSLWAEAVAPHCHHFDARADAIILQYPPGTGFLLSLFHDGIGWRMLLISSMTILLACFTLQIILGGTWSVLALSLSAAALLMVDARYETVSYSVAPSLALSSVAALTTVAALRTTNRLPLIVLGLAIGLASAVRLANVFMLVGVGLIFLYRFGRTRTRSSFLDGLTVLLATFAGLSPVLLANYINVGSVFSGTYSQTDIGFMLSRANIVARFFDLFGGSDPTELANIVAAAVVAVSLLAISTEAAFAGAISFVSLTCFLLMKQIVNGYYLAPMSAYAILCVTLPITRVSRIAVSGAIVCAVAFVVFFANTPFASTREAIAPNIEQRLGQNTIVWSDTFSGFYILKENTYAAKLIFAAPHVQDAMISSLREQHVRQLFSDSTPQMHAVVMRLGARLRLLPGLAFGQHIFELVEKNDMGSAE